MSIELRPGRRTRTRTGSTAAADRTGNGGMHTRFAARALQLRRRARRVWVWPAAVLVLVAALVVTLWWSPALVVKEVTVTGAQGDLGAGAEQRASIPLGVPLARLDTDAAAGRVEEDLRIARAEVSRDWPSGVTIDVDLRRPALVVDQAGASSLQLADAAGVIYDRTADRPTDLMLVRTSRGEVQATSLSGVVTMLAALSPEVAQEVSSVQITAQGNLRFSVGSVTVQWGSPDTEKLKATVLEALFAQKQIDPDAERRVEVDLATPQTPVVTGLIPDQDF